MTLPSLAAALLLALAPLPWTTQLLSYAHPKEALILGLTALCFLPWCINGMRESQRRAIWGMGLLCVPPLIWFIWGVARGSSHPEPQAAAIVGIGTLAAALGLAPLSRNSGARTLLDTASILGALAVSLLGLLQYAGLIDALFPTYAHYDQRIYSVFGNQDLLGGYMAVALVMLWNGALRTKMHHLPLHVIQLPIAGALVLSGCRSAWMAAAVGLAMTVVAHRKSWRQLLALSTIPALAAALGLFFAWESTGARLTRVLHATDIGGSVRLWIWDATLRMAWEHPIAGIGPGRFASASPMYMGDALSAMGDGVYAYNEAWAMHPHSEPLAIVAEGGLIGVMLALAFLTLLWRSARIDRAWPALTTMSIFAMVNDAWHSAPHGLLSLWLLACATGGMPRTPEKNSSELLARLLPVGLLVLSSCLLLAHACYVVRPSWLLTHAEDLAFTGKDPVGAYAEAAKHPFTHAESQLGLSVHHTKVGNWAAALQAATEARTGLDTHMVHWLEGLAAAQLGEKERARTALEKCLHRAPRNQPAFNLLWTLSDSDGHIQLAQHAKRWNLVLPE